MSLVEERLHVDKLKSRFEGYNKITIDDFYEFYKEVFSEIKRGTVKWYVYELKNKNIIRNISRGQYVIEDSQKVSENEHIVITMDIIKSTKLNYNDFNEMLTKRVKEINRSIQKNYIKSGLFNVSHGDELQILIPFDEDFGELIMLSLSYLHPFEVRYGISIGSIDGKIRENTWEMNGPIFWNARDQLERLKNSKSYSGLVISGYHKTDRISNNILPLVNKSISRITDKQWEAIKHNLAQNDIQQAMNEMDISKTSYYDRLSGSNLNEIINSFKTIYDLMMIRKEIN